MLPLEAEHEVEHAEVDVSDAARAVAAPVEPQASGDVDRLRQRRLAPEVQGAERGDLDRQPARVLLEQRSRERAATAVPGADDCDLPRTSRQLFNSIIR